MRIIGPFFDGISGYDMTEVIPDIANVSFPFTNREFVTRIFWSSKNRASAALAG
jgi:hypothetical protein